MQSIVERKLSQGTETLRIYSWLLECGWYDSSWIGYSNGVSF